MNNIYLSDEDYDFIYSRAPRICIDLLVKNSKGEVLLTKRDIEPYKDHWHFPGGRVKFRETIAEAIRRIAKAELGETIQGDNFPKVGVCEFLEEEQKGQPRHSISIVHELVIFSSVEIELKLDNQAKEYRFFNQMPEPIIPPQKEFLNKAGYK